MTFRNKIAIVTGGSSGIGESTISQLLSQNTTVINLDISSPNITNKLLKFIEIDVTDEESVIETIKNLYKEFDQIDFLINSAGVTARNALANEFSDYELWKRVLDVNLNGTYLVSREVVKYMILKKSGSIVNLSSIMGRVVYPQILNSLTSPYPISKGGIVQYTKNLASYVADKGIRVNCVSPAFIITDLTKNILEDEVIGNELKSRTPMKRFGTPEEVANVINFLCSDKSSYITGIDIPVDGGYLIL
jgi:NAD(P)-dependent dehydrogenase (short-subunit alcohol dehydrogenase family)